MADIAEKLDISVVSVSKALAGKPGVSEEMRARVVALARQMGYESGRMRPEAAGAGDMWAPLGSFTSQTDRLIKRFSPARSTLPLLK